LLQLGGSQPSRLNDEVTAGPLLQLGGSQSSCLNDADMVPLSQPGLQSSSLRRFDVESGPLLQPGSQSLDCELKAFMSVSQPGLQSSRFELATLGTVGPQSSSSSLQRWLLAAKPAGGVLQLSSSHRFEAANMLPLSQSLLSFSSSCFGPFHSSFFWLELLMLLLGTVVGTGGLGAETIFAPAGATGAVTTSETTGAAGADGSGAVRTTGFGCSR
jgi:hypothetical protein